MLQLLQLTLVVAALIIWPAALVPDGLGTARIYLLFAAYWLFFASGTLIRLLAHGQLAPRSKDKQSSSWASRLAWLLFVIMIPLLHWLPIGRFVAFRKSYFLTSYDVIGSVCILAGILLNAWAAQHLGKAYDRVVRPEKLVTSGPYRAVQHPIYTSYMLLFFGYCMALHSAPCALLMLLVCLLYYSSRTALEAQVLREAFGAEYDSYAAGRKKYIPLLL